MKTPGYLEYEKLCDELDRKTKEACEEFKRGMDRLYNQGNPVPWDWSTTPPWINWIAMWGDGEWFMFDEEPIMTEHMYKGWVGGKGESVSHFIPKSHSPHGPATGSSQRQCGLDTRRLSERTSQNQSRCRGLAQGYIR